MSQDVLISVGVDLAPLQREFARAQRLTADFSRHLARATATVPDPPIDRAALAAAATRAATAHPRARSSGARAGCGAAGRARAGPAE
jgi:hypothetical protein